MVTSVHAQWQSINPGAGGQVQDVVCAPGTPGTLYLASDMEGVYKSTDNGEHWHITGDLVHNRVYAVAVDPTNAEQIYVGTLFGLQVSSDGGQNYTVVKKALGESFGAIAIDPHNHEHIIAGMGWRDDYDFVKLTDNEKNGIGRYLESFDRGKTWRFVTYDKDRSGDKNVWTISFSLAQRDEIYISSGRGLFKTSDDGRHWKKLSAPANTIANRGAALSPDGKVVYTAYSYSGRHSNIYASSTHQINWQKVMDGLPEKKIGFWYPEVDPRSLDDDHEVLISIEGERDGLFEGSFQWKDGMLSKYQWDLIWTGTDGYDFGWDWADPNPRYVHYTPIGWERAVWSTTNENMFAGIKRNGVYQWYNKYSKPNDKFMVDQWGKQWAAYSGRGTESTYTYDIAAYENYVIQGQGDNGLMESWDGGYSYSNIQHRTDSLNFSDVQAVTIGKAGETPVVLAQATTGYGGNARDGRLFVKELNSMSPQDKWIMIGGGPGELLGLPSGIYRDVVVAPSNPSKVYLFSNGHGLYQIEDLTETIAKFKDGVQIPAKKVSNELLSKVITTKKIAVHPTNENVVFLASAKGEQGVFRGEEVNGNWQWKKIYGGSSWEAEVVSWVYNDKVYLAYSGTPENYKKCGCNYTILLSDDEGQSWKEILSPDMAMDMRADDVVSWYPYIKRDYIFQNKGGLAAKGNTIIINFYNHKYQNGIGLFRGTIHTNGSVAWEDWTGDLHYPGVTSAIIAPYQGQDYVYISTPGAGAWKRPLRETKLTNK